MPGAGARVSNVPSSVQSYVTRPTANGPVGVGSVMSLLCSNQSDPINAPIPRTPNRARTAMTFSARRTRRALSFVGHQDEDSEAKEMKIAMGPPMRFAVSFALQSKGAQKKPNENEKNLGQ